MVLPIELGQMSDRLPKVFSNLHSHGNNDSDGNATQNVDLRYRILMGPPRGREPQILHCMPFPNKIIVLGL